MKKINKFFFAAAVASMAFAACQVEETNAPDANGVKMVEVGFGAEVSEAPASKATLSATDATETAFAAAWTSGDQIFVEYATEDDADDVVATWNGSAFTATIPAYNGHWLYEAVYPVPDASNKVDFGGARTQKGNAYNSKYDVMIGSAEATSADAGKDNAGNPVVFAMERQTAIQYFHFTSDLDEAVESATLSVTGGHIASNNASVSSFAWDASEYVDEITITFPESAPNAQDFQLWFNVLETEYTSLSLTVTTATKTFTLTKASSGVYVRGYLFKVKKSNIAWSNKGGDPDPVETVITENFASSGATTNAYDCSSAISTDDNRKDFDYTWTIDGAGTVFKNGIKLGKSGGIGTITSSDILEDVPAGNYFTVKVYAAVWNTDGGKVVVSYNGSSETKDAANAAITATGSVYSADDFASSTDFTFVKVNGVNTLTIGSSVKRILVDKVEVVYTPGDVPVVVNVASVSLDETSIELTEGETQQLTATVAPDDATNKAVTWSSSDEAVATVVDGLVTAVSAGNATITVKTVDGNKTATCAVTVSAPASLATIDEIFAAATAAGSTDTPAKVTFDNWVVSAVKNSNAYVTDGTKGFIVYTSSHGFVAGDIISGTADVNVVLYNGSAEVKGLKASTPGITVTKGGSVAPSSVALADLSAVNTGSIVSYSNLLYDGTNFTDGETSIKPYNTFITLPSLVSGKRYNVRGVFIMFKTDKEIAPLAAADFEVIDIKYNVNIASMTNGSVTANVATASEGEQVTLTVTPASGYKLGTLTVTTASSVNVSVSANKFTMPAENVTVSATFVENTGGATPIFSEDFSSVTTGNSTATANSGTAWPVNSNFSASNLVYQAGGAIKLGSSKNAGSITTKALDLSQAFTVTLDVKGWTTVEGDIIISCGSESHTISYSSVMDDDFETISQDFAAATSSSKIVIATSAKRAFIDNIVVTYK